MAFVRYKTVNGKKYYQLVRNHREGGKHRQEVLDHFGQSDSIEAAIEDAKERAAFHQKQAAYWIKRAKDREADLLARYGDVLGGKLPSPREIEVRREYEWPTFHELEARLPELKGLWASNGGPIRYIQRDFQWWIVCRDQIHNHRSRQENYQAKLAKRLNLQREYFRLSEPDAADAHPSAFEDSAPPGGTL